MRYATSLVAPFDGAAAPPAAASNSAARQSAKTNTRMLRIGIASFGPSHLSDLAGAFDRLGTDVRLYSDLSHRAASRRGLRRRSHVSLRALLAPLLSMQRRFPRVSSGMVERLLYWALDLSVILRMQPCDVFICPPGFFLRAPRFAQWRHGARIVMHSASEHILARDELLANVPGATRPSERAIWRELSGYELADLIVVPSAHVADTFAAWSVRAVPKLYRNPIGPAECNRLAWRSYALRHLAIMSRRLGVKVRPTRSARARSAR
jgi:hypothetical protein